MLKKVNKKSRRDKKKKNDKIKSKEQIKEDNNINFMDEFKSILLSKINEPHEFNIFHSMKKYNKHLINLKNKINNDIEQIKEKK